MATSGAVQVKLELGHRAQVRRKPTVEGFTHDWMVFVRGPEHSNIQHFVEKVVFHLHESFPRPKRVCKDPPYKVEESGYAGFILPIEVYFKNKEEPKKVRFDYDLFLHLEGHPPVNHLRCEKLTFNNPTEEFRRKLLRAGGQRDPHKRSTDDSKVMVMQEGSTSLFGQHLKLPSLPSSSLTLTFSDAKKSKSSHGSHGSKDGSRSSSTLTTTAANSSSSSKVHKPSKEHKDKSSKDSKEHKSAFKDSAREPSRLSKESSRKPKENQPIREDQPIPKMAFKEPKTISKDHKSDANPLHGGLQHGAKAPGKRLSAADSEDHVTKKRKKGFSEVSVKPPSSSSPLQHHHHQLEKKQQPKDKSQVRPAKLKVDSESLERRKPSTLPPFHDLVDPNDSDMEDGSNKSESEQPSPASSSSSSSTSFPPAHNRQVLAPLQSIMQDLHSEDNEESEEEEANDVDSDLERPLQTHTTHRSRRVSLSDGSESENSSASSPLPRNEPPPLLKTSANQILEVKSPIKHAKPEKNLKNIDCDKAYLDELVELHRRLMALRERHILQQIVNLIEETGHFHITNTTFDFDLCSLDRTTVRKLQSYLETSGTP
ncbi:protein AF-9 isoform X2 [Scleropages formosus]|uniref:protein AF-9 isoform X2 n=1 Tax=Scleropages formosus TaxID=113540 RepID=UPI000877EB1A|nr:protein AF-9 isoform X2 [Scleropages formosus]